MRETSTKARSRKCSSDKNFTEQSSTDAIFYLRACLNSDSRTRTRAFLAKFNGEALLTLPPRTVCVFPGNARAGTGPARSDGRICDVVAGVGRCISFARGGLLSVLILLFTSSGKKISIA
jgi:hypothetical protein